MQDILRRAPSAGVFADLVDLALTQHRSGALKSEVVTTVERQLAQWSTEIARVIPSALRDEVRDLPETVPLYRWTFPIDLTLIPFSRPVWDRTVEKLQTSGIPASHLFFYEPKRWPMVDYSELGDWEVDGQPFFLKAIGSCLESEYGLKPVSLVCTPNEFRTLSATSAQAVKQLEDSTLAFHHGDITLTGTLSESQLPADYTYVTGDLLVEGAVQVEAPSRQFLMLGGTLRADDIELHAPFSIEGAIRAKTLYCGEDNDVVCSVAQIHADLALVGWVLHSSGSACRLLVDPAGYWGDDTENRELAAAVLQPELVEEMERIAPQLRGGVCRWLWSELRPKILLGDKVWR